MKRLLFNNFFLTALIIAVIFTVNGCSKNTNSETSPASLPTIITNGLISNLTSTTAQSGGIITNNGGADLTASGICYSSTNQTPTVADSKTIDLTSVDPANTKSFTSNITGLTVGTVYYLRAYSTNSAGTGYGSVVKFTTSTTITSVTSAVSTLAGSLTAGFLNASGASALFYNPQSVTTDALGNVYVADSFNEMIREITPGGSVSTYAGNDTAGYREGAAATAEFYGPQGVAMDAQGNMYVADIGNNVIRKITAAGVVSTLAGNGTRGYINGAGTTVAEFNNPQSVAVDASGNVYVADRGNNVIRKITAAGVVSTLAGVGPANYLLYQEESIPTFGYLDGTNPSVLFNTPKGIAVDASGNVYVADAGNYCIRKITPAGVVTTYAGGPVQTTVVGTPTDVAFDTKGNLYISDQDGRILEITTAKVLYVLAGSANTSGYADGAGTVAQFNSPQGLTVDASGNVYVADYNNNTIRKIVVTIQ